MTAHCLGGSAQELGPDAGKPAVSPQDKVLLTFGSYLHDRLGRMAKTKDALQFQPRLLSLNLGVTKNLAILADGEFLFLNL